MEDVEKYLIDIMVDTILPKTKIMINRSEILNQEVAVVSIEGCDKDHTTTIIDASDNPEIIARWNIIKDWMDGKYGRQGSKN